MKQPLVHILLADVTALRICVGFVAWLFAFGLLFADVNGGAYNDMLRHAPAGVWAFAFAIYGGSKFAIALNWPYTTNKYVAGIVIALGIYLWMFTFLSFANNPNRPMGAADMMILFMLFAEVWVGAHTLADAQ